MPFLWSYAKAGGNLVMQYNTNQDTTVDQLGMYNFSIANKRVTEENASVKFLNPGHKLLNFPNKITADDFKGWVQERVLISLPNGMQRMNRFLKCMIQAKNLCRDQRYMPNMVKVILFIPRWRFSDSCLREMWERHVYFLTFYLHRRTDEQAT